MTSQKIHLSSKSTNTSFFQTALMSFWYMYSDPLVLFLVYPNEELVSIFLFFLYFFGTKWRIGIRWWDIWQLQLTSVVSFISSVTKRISGFIIGIIRTTITHNNQLCCTIFVYKWLNQLHILHHLNIYGRCEHQKHGKRSRLVGCHVLLCSVW